MHGQRQHKVKDERALVVLTHLFGTDRSGNEEEEEEEEDFGETGKQFKTLGSSMSSGYSALFFISSLVASPISATVKQHFPRCCSGRAQQLHSASEASSKHNYKAYMSGCCVVTEHGALLNW